MIVGALLVLMTGCGISCKETADNKSSLEWGAWVILVFATTVVLVIVGSVIFIGISPLPVFSGVALWGLVSLRDLSDSCKFEPSIKIADEFCTTDIYSERGHYGLDFRYLGGY